METQPFSLLSLTREMGWNLAGVTAPEISEKSQNQFLDWIENREGSRLDYMKRRSEERLQPTRYFQEAKSILCFGLYYFPGWNEGQTKISNYSWGEDYHEVLKLKLQKTVEALQRNFGDFRYRICVDTSPVLEKTLAVQAGIGWQGKNTLVLNPKFGSFLFLGEIFTDLEVSRFQVLPIMKDHCGTCNRCIEACPTQALESYVLKLDRCIAYWNLEHRGPIPDDAPSFQNWLGGCDICQEVCPWNQKLTPIPGIPKDLTQIDLASISDEVLSQIMKGRALSYIPNRKWRANLDHLKKST